ncbi:MULTISPECIES: NAD-dependent epimerase/dehydratase family protein [Pseudomonas]|uniref:NAD-dependent epimerase/dehydratase family protein n=1 Tax=Pseudomonas wuhanensis TaxID=2954098 RepID=A0ABY9GYE0_9PSED|nr:MULTISPECIES: NAD-dependent epimerase/dehydratase family protein [unclassified Pseudomonas]WLI14794.1 NAD-dependent epimerase/dehydratase family protein [Pseudomonas sp. FP603]WLI20718.1 NAD-dependent epimerase/dehydratase family protein [Pseudomonas sp. FP607]
MTVLVTGAAGFIGYHTVKRLCREGLEVVGIDNLNDYYSVELKHARLKVLESLPGFRFQTLDIVDKPALMALFQDHAFTEVVHLAAQPGVRYSLDTPDVYAQSNLVGFLNVLEACRHHRPAHLIYASSSSVYGSNSKMPFSVEDSVDHPISLYAATKRANELLAHSYCHLYGLKASGLRFFTVFGPWGRPDMALFKFTEAIIKGLPIDIYNHGQMSRDFTYIDDIVESIARLRSKPPVPNGPEDGVNRIFNIGRGQPVPLLEFVDCLETALGIKARRNFLPLQAGDVVKTWADVSALAEWVDFRPQVTVETGVAEFVKWYRHFYQI